jgi:hypothetical protein
LSSVHTAFAHQQPQIIVEGRLRKALKSDVITFRLRVLRVIELSFIVAVPFEGMNTAPVFIRFGLDKSQGDKPGTTPAIEGI